MGLWLGSLDARSSNSAVRKQGLANCKFFARFLNNNDPDVYNNCLELSRSQALTLPTILETRQDLDFLIEKHGASSLSHHAAVYLHLDVRNGSPLFGPS